MQKYLEVEDLSFSYERGFSFDSKCFFLEKEKIIGIEGVSGSGKTTFFRLLAGLLNPKKGKIVLDGKTLFDDKINIEPNKRNIGLVFQDYALFPHLTVEKNIIFAFQAAKKKYSEKDIADRLKWAHLEKVAQQYPSELSGGQQQRVALIRALIPAPKLLLMDEPFVGLDLSLRQRIIEQSFQLLRESQMSALIVTHNVCDIEKFIDQTVPWNEK